jgi:hypothetical protein
MDSKLAVKISVSLPEALKGQLDHYAGEHDLSVSQTVQQALEAFFQAPPPPGPEPPPNPSNPLLEQMVMEMNRQLQDACRELARTQQVLEQHREFMQGLGPMLQLSGVYLSLPPSLHSPPPWSTPPPPPPASPWS